MFVSTNRDDPAIAYEKRGQRCGGGAERRSVPSEMCDRRAATRAQCSTRSGSDLQSEGRGGRGSSAWSPLLTRGGRGALDAVVFVRGRPLQRGPERAASIERREAYLDLVGLS